MIAWQIFATMAFEMVPNRVFLFLVIGLVAASQSGNIIRLGDAHPVAIAAWRLLIAALLMALLAGKRLAELRRLSRREIVFVFLAGASLALHFFSWIAAVQLTKVANAAIFFSVNPVIMAVAARIVFKERVGIRLGAAAILGVVGVGVIGFNDLDLQTEHLMGDAWALICAVFCTAYFLLGKRLRKVLPNVVYVTAAYGIGALVSFILLVSLELPPFDYNRQTWLCFILMALVPTMIGHTALNNSLRYIRASWLSVTTLTEPLLAGVVAYFAWGEGITIQVALGYLLICVSVLVLVVDRPD